MDNRAVQATMERARRAAQTFAALSMRNRMAALERLQSAIWRHADELAAAISADLEQPLQDAWTADIAPVIEAISYYHRKSPRLLSKHRRRTPWLQFSARSYVEYAPYGVVVVIAPWNFPLQLALVPAVTALAAGNAVIVKPSERLAHFPKLLLEVVAGAGLPTDVLQVALGGPEVAHALVESRPNKVFFTGRESSGRVLAVQAAKLGVPIDLELAGNSPMIVFADANLARAAKAAAWGAFFHGGQVCVSIERLFVEKTVYPEFLRLFLDEVRKITRYTDTSARGDTGSVLLLSDATRLRALVDSAIAGGAKIAIGGWSENAASEPIWQPTVITDVGDDMAVMQTEVFGPVVSVTTFETEAEVVVRVNAGRYGLNASVFSSNLERSRRVTSKLQSGCVVVNDVVRNITNMDMPFGGVKASGSGRYRGPEGLYAFAQPKAVMVHSGRSQRQVNWFPYRPETVRAFRQLLALLYRGRRP